MPLQDPGMKPPDETDVLSCSRSASDRRQKSNVNADQVLKCPRCESMNTKFCYYNNYSLTQPRHFCKNCRRYWTKGGALRNVPVGGGCRKNKRIKQRSVDPNSLVSLDEGTSNMLASINGSNCTPLLPNFSGPSSSSFVDLANDNHRFGLTFARIQESIRLGEHSGAVSSNQSAYGLGAGSSQVNPGMLNASCGQPSLVNSLPTGFEGGLLHLSYPNGTVKLEPSNALYNGSDLSSLFETPAQMAGVGTAALPSLEDQLSSYSVPVEIYNGCGAETQFRLQPQKLAMQLMHDVHIGDQRQMLAPYEDERNDNLRRMKGKSIHPCLGEGRSHPDWQGVPENLFETAGDSNLWSNTGWPELHALAGSAAGSMM